MLAAYYEAAFSKSNSRSVSYTKNDLASTSSGKLQESRFYSAFLDRGANQYCAHKIHLPVKFVHFSQTLSTIPYSRSYKNAVFLVGKLLVIFGDLKQRQVFGVIQRQSLTSVSRAGFGAKPGGKTIHTRSASREKDDASGTRADRVSSFPQ
jgi:hypothetical protein